MFEEETGLRVQLGSEMRTQHHDHEHGSVELYFFYGFLVDDAQTARSLFK